MQSKVAQPAPVIAQLDVFGVAALGLALSAMAAALAAPALGLLVLAGLSAVAMAGGDGGRAIRFDRLALAGCAAVAAAAAAGGLSGATGAAFVWFVVDCARAQGRRAGSAAAGAMAERLSRWLAAGFAVLLVAAAAPHVVMGLPLNLPHPPSVMILAVGIVYALATADWTVRVLARWRLGEGRLAPALSPLAFHVLLLAGFGLCTDVSAGLVGLIAYRLAQHPAVQGLAPRWRLAFQAGS
jgi:hypothetical protein